MFPSITDKRFCKMKSISVKKGFGIGSLIFVAAAVILLPVRTLQFFTVLENDTGFYSASDWSVYLLNAVAALAVIAIFVFGFAKRKKLDYSLEVTKRPGFGILSITAAAGALAAAANGIISFMSAKPVVSETASASNFILAAQALFALLSAIYFIALGIASIGSKSNGSEYRLISLAPVIWSIFRIVYRFTRTISYIRVSELMFEMLMIVFLILFFMSFAQVNSQVSGKNNEWKIGAYGLPAALLALICFVPRFIVTLTGNADLLHEQSPIEYCDISNALFILAAVFTRLTDKISENNSSEEEA